MSNSGFVSFPRMPDIIRLRVVASTMSATLTGPCATLDAQRIEWFVEFDGQGLPTDRMWRDDFAQIVGPLVSPLKAALEGADRIGGLKIPVYAEDDGADMSWGFKFEGPPIAVDPLGGGAAITSTRH